MKITFNNEVSAMWASRYKLENNPFSGNLEKIIEAKGDIQCFNFGAGKVWLIPKGATKPKADSPIKETYLSFLFENYPKISDCDSRCKLLDKSSGHFIDELKSNCPEAEVKAGAIEETDPLIAGLFIKDQMVAGASVIEYKPNASDIGVIVNPNFRRQGLAYEVVKFLSHHIHLTKRLGHYGCDQKNIGSHKNAQKLGLTLAMVIDTY